MKTEQQERKFQLLRKLRRRLRTLENKASKASNHGGYDDLLNDMFRCEDKIIEFVSKEIENLPPELKFKRIDSR